MSTATTDLRRSWLVQRLNKPRGTATILGADNPFAFGGGMKNGGLSDEAMGLLRDIFSFDYMGAAEFEFGKVPKALQAIAKRADTLAAFSFPITLSKVEADFRDKRPAPEGTGTVYVLCPGDWADAVQARIEAWAAEAYNRDLKETLKLSGALRPFHEWDHETAGWLELDNGFMFFTDRDMWAATAALFGVSINEAIVSG
jgi:hypothetical protein